MPFEPSPPRRPTLWEAWTPLQLSLYALLLLGANMFWQVVVYNLTGSIFIPVLAAGLLAVVLPCLGASWWHGQSLVNTFDLRPGIAAIGLGLAAGLLAWLPAGVLADLSARLRPPSPEYLEYLTSNLPRGTAGLVTAYVAVGLAAPLAEEMVFRGLLYRAARSRWGVGGSMVLTSLFFGVAHWEPWALFGLVALGMLLCVLYERTGSLLAPVLAHGVHNVISLSVLLHDRDVMQRDQTAAPTAWLAAGACVVVLVLVLRRFPMRARS